MPLCPFAVLRFGIGEPDLNSLLSLHIPNAFGHWEKDHVLFLDVRAATPE
jgi:hypothetical protein